MASTQTKAKDGCCSTIGNIEKHEKFKQLPKEVRIQSLQDVYDKYGGVKSPEFFTQVKPLIMWTVYRYLRGMHYSNLEDLVNNAYEELVIAFEGGYTTFYNKPVYKEPQYGTPEYYEEYKNMGEFVMHVVGCSVGKYRSKNYRNQCTHEDTTQDISDKLSFTDFEVSNTFGYELEEPELVPLFTTFSFNEAMKIHLKALEETQPRNNILYNFIIWRRKQQ